MQLGIRCKYQSYWYGNALALTIYVNANELCFLSQHKAAFRAKACNSARRSPPRG
jgi:hypothetical protein